MVKRRVIGDRKKKLKEWGFTRTTVFGRDRIYIMAFLESLKDEKESVTAVYKWDGSWSHWLVEWPCIGIASGKDPNPGVFTLGLGGRVHIARQTGFSEEDIDTSEDGPPHRAQLRDIRFIDGSVHVAGIGRQAYRRDGNKRWTRIDKGALAPKGKATGTGFNSIDGFAGDDLYAVGGKGEIWHYNGKKWTQIDSPTNLVLERVVCAPDKKVYVCGQAGTLIRGREDSWEVVEHEATEDDLWGMTWFGDKIWTASLDAVFSLDGDQLTPADMGKPSLTCGWLDAKDGVMWSSGEDDLAYTDGKDWYEVILE